MQNIPKLNVLEEILIIIQRLYILLYYTNWEY